MIMQNMFTSESRSMWDIQCARCKEWKKRTEFPLDKRKRNGLSSWCKSCRSEDKRERYANNTNGYRDNTRKAQRARWNGNDDFREAQKQKNNQRNRSNRANPEYRKRENKGTILRRYGLTEDEYDAMLEATGGKCPICEVDLDFEDVMSGQRAVVDHCHACGSDGKRNPIGNFDSIRGIVCRKCNIDPQENGKPSLRWAIHVLRHEAICKMRTAEERETAKSDLQHLEQYYPTS